MIDVVSHVVREKFRKRVRVLNKIMAFLVETHRPILNRKLVTKSPPRDTVHYLQVIFVKFVLESSLLSAVIHIANLW